MTGEELLTLGVAIVVPVSALIYSNSRVGDLKELIRAEIGGLRSEMKNGFANVDAKLKLHETEVKARMDGMDAKLNAGFERIEAKLIIHELEHHK